MSKCLHLYPLRKKLKKAFLKDYVMFIDSLSQMVFFFLQETNSGHRILIITE